MNDPGKTLVDVPNLGVSFERMSIETDVVGYPVLPLVTQLAEMVEEKHAMYIHWGATTQDIMDTATVLQVRDGLILVRKHILSLIDCLRTLSVKYRDVYAYFGLHILQAMLTKNQTDGRENPFAARSSHYIRLQMRRLSLRLLPAPPAPQ